MKVSERFFYAIPLGVLRRFINENKDEPDNFIQLFELKSDQVFSEKELPELREKSMVIINRDNMPEHKEE